MISTSSFRASVVSTISSDETASVSEDAHLGSRILRLSGRLEGLNRKWRRKGRRISSPEAALRDAQALWLEIEEIRLPISAAFSLELLRHTSDESDRLGWDAAEVTKVTHVGRSLNVEEADVYFVSLLTQLIESPHLSSTPPNARAECARQLLPGHIRNKIPSAGPKPKVGFGNRWVHPRNVLGGPMTSPERKPSRKPSVRSFVTRSMGIGRALPQLLQYLGLRLFQKHRDKITRRPLRQDPSSIFVSPFAANVADPISHATLQSQTGVDSPQFTQTVEPTDVSPPRPLNH
jgi:hypothetical protein